MEIIVISLLFSVLILTVLVIICIGTFLNVSAVKDNKAEIEDIEDDLIDIHRFSLTLPVAQSITAGTTAYPSVIDDVYKLVPTVLSPLILPKLAGAPDQFGTIMVGTSTCILYDNLQYKIVPLGVLNQILPTKAEMVVFDPTDVYVNTEILPVDDTHVIKFSATVANQAVIVNVFTVDGAQLVNIQNTGTVASTGVITSISAIQVRPFQYAVSVTRTGNAPSLYTIELDPITYVINTFMLALAQGPADSLRTQMVVVPGTSHVLISCEFIPPPDDTVQMQLYDIQDATAPALIRFDNISISFASLKLFVSSSNNIVIAAQHATYINFFGIDVNASISVNDTIYPQIAVTSSNGIDIVTTGSNTIVAPRLDTMQVFRVTNNNVFQVRNSNINPVQSTIALVSIVSIDKWRIMYSTFDDTTDTYTMSVIDMSTILPMLNVFVDQNASQGDKLDVTFMLDNVVSDINHEVIEFPISSNTHAIFTPSLTKQITFELKE